MRKAILLSFLLAFSLYAQNKGKIAGYVRDAKTKEGLPGVNVVLKDTRLGAITDIEGAYFVINIPPGIYEVTASIIGYQKVTQENVQISSDRTTTVNFSLQEAALNIVKEVVVVAERPDVSPEKTSTSDIIRGEQALSLPGTRDLTAVMSLSPDIIDGHFRGGREGEELYTLAGMGVVNPLDNALAVAPILSAVEEIEVITSGFSAKYGNAQSGVVNISLKEGSRNKWQSRAEFRSRMPAYKHWGANVWDSKNNPYLQLMNSPEKMRSNEDSTRLFLANFLSLSNYKNDTTLASRLAYAMYTQNRRNIGGSYNNTWDYSAEANVGGPLSNDVTLFLAGRFANTWPVIPPPEPDVTRQLIANLAFSLGDGMSLRLSGAFSNNDRHDYRALGSATSLDYRYWIWDRVMGLNKISQDNYTYGLRYTYSPTPNTFYEAKVSGLMTRVQEGSPVIATDRFRTDDVLGNALWRVLTGGDGYRIGYMDSGTRDEKTFTFSVDASMTSQVTRSHLLLAGMQFNSFNIDVNNQTGRANPGTAHNEIYIAKPIEWSLFVQDKMEFQGMIANIGLRLDAYNQKVGYYKNVFTPLEGAETEKTPTIGRLQPRIGISFPVSTMTVFHMNYGSFLQRPSFQYTIAKSVSLTGRIPSLIGNPQLKPQDTKSYDVGLTQGFGKGFTLDISSYYKDVSNLIERVYFYPAKGALEFYETYMNRDYADIRGFRISFNRRSGILTGSLNYNFQVATGKSSTPFDASPIIRENTSASRKTDTPDPEDILLDFDRTHNVVLVLGVETPVEFGPQVFGAFPFEQLSVSSKSFIRSGRPYTSDLDFGERFKRRTPSEQNTDLKISKQIKHFFGVSATFYAEVFNLFNSKIYEYNPVFRNPINRNKFESDQGQLPLWVSEENQIYTWDISYLLYDNAPRSIWFGLVINF
ncbi:MAG: TonB-dependent receptor [bacterium]